MILTFIIPRGSGERISFATTVMLSIVVFLLILSDNLPKTATSPLISLMFIGLLLFSLIGLFAVISISALNEYPELCLKNGNNIQDDSGNIINVNNSDKFLFKIEFRYTLFFIISFIGFIIGIIFKIPDYK